MVRDRRWKEQSVGACVTNDRLRHGVGLTRWTILLGCRASRAKLTCLYAVGDYFRSYNRSLAVFVHLTATQHTRARGRDEALGARLSSTHAPQSHSGRHTAASGTKASLLLLLNREKAEIIIYDTCQICVRPRRRVTILQMVSMQRFACLRMAAPIELAAPHQSRRLGGFSPLIIGEKHVGPGVFTARRCSPRDSVTPSAIPIVSRPLRTGRRGYNSIKRHTGGSIVALEVTARSAVSHLVHN